MGSDLRVKVYRLNDGKKWDDKGTGHVSLEYLDVFKDLQRSEGVGLVVLDEKNYQTLLIHHISADDIYRRQEDTIISWTDPEVETDLALSFQETTSCSYIWDQICSLQRVLQVRTVGALDSLPRPIGDDLEHSGTSQDDDDVLRGGGGEFSRLPPVELGTLPQLVKAVSEVPHFDRDRVAALVLRDVTAMECTSVANDNHLDVFRESAQLVSPPVSPGFLSLGLPLGNSRHNIDTSVASDSHLDMSRESAQLVPPGFLSLEMPLGNSGYKIDTSVANNNYLDVSMVNAHQVDVPGLQDPSSILYTRKQSAGNLKGLISFSSIQDHFHKCSCRRINDIFVSDVIIGYGSDGTTVKEGHMGFRKVAVKLVLGDFYEKVDREIRLLIESDGHPNVVKYYNVAQDSQFIYLALERCSFSLYDLICSQTLEDQDMETRKRVAGKGLKPCSEEDFKLWNGRRPSAQLFQIMCDIVNGLVHLHVLGIVHRDLKPHNVLISRGQRMLAKIADMGLSKLLNFDEVSFSNTTGPGTRGWQAPEQLQRNRGSSKMDIFALGCVLYYCVSKGKHPFGSHYERDVNIVQAKMDLSHIAVDNPEAADLIECLLDPDPRKRPSAHEILVHPFFWDAQKSLSFFKDTSNRVKFDKEQSTSFLPEDVKSTRPSVSYSPWKGKLDVPLVDYIRNHGSYDFKTIGDLLRAIRNLDAHFTELPEPLQVLLGRGSNGLYEYFRSRYPRLLIETYHVIGYHYKAHPTFAHYFPASFESKFVPYR